MSFVSCYYRDYDKYDKISTDHLVLQDLNEEYIRKKSKESIELSDKLKKKYGYSTFITDSGLSALALTIILICELNNNQKITLYYPDETDWNTPHTIEYLRKIFKYDVVKFSMKNHYNELYNMKHNNDHFNILFSESCSNPNGILFNYDILNHLKKNNNKWLCIIDNTWLTHLIQNPFKFGADIVILSLTKYYSSNKCICGCIITTINIVDFEYFMENMGVHVSPINCKIVSDNMKTMKKRMKKTTKRTKIIIEKYKNINHPYIYDINKNIINKFVNTKYYPPTFTIMFHENKNKVLDKIKKSGIINKTSFGDRYSMINPYYKINNTSVIIRLAIGYGDSIKKIINKLDILFS